MANVGRVIARPFVGESRATFKRTPNRRDYAVPPPEPTLLDRLTDAGRQVFSVGKIGDIFAHRGTGTILKAPNDMALFDRTLEAMGRPATAISSSPTSSTSTRSTATSATSPATPQRWKRPAHPAGGGEAFDRPR
jgi:hypothetical protein